MIRPKAITPRVDTRVRLSCWFSPVCSLDVGAAAPEGALPLVRPNGGPVPSACTRDCVGDQPNFDQPNEQPNLSTKELREERLRDARGGPHEICARHGRRPSARGAARDVNSALWSDGRKIDMGHPHKQDGAAALLGRVSHANTVEPIVPTSSRLRRHLASPWAQQRSHASRSARSHSCGNSCTFSLSGAPSQYLLSL